jgi:SAM-dependent methyltransferase
LRQYALWKLRLDPGYGIALPHLAGARHIVDLGAGIGLLDVLIAGRTPAAKIVAVEWDAVKASAARDLTDGIPGVVVIQGDARTFSIPSCDAIVMFDILHYSDLPSQREWLARAAAALLPGGRLVIRELDGRGTLATGLERIAVTLGLNQAGGVHPRRATELAADLESLGLLVSVSPAGRAAFRANALLVAVKPTS